MQTTSTPTAVAAPIYPQGWKFDVDDCATHVQDDPYPMLIVERHHTSKGRPIYKAASLKPENAGFELMIFEEVLREPRASRRDCAACVFNGTRSCPVTWIEEAA